MAPKSSTSQPLSFRHSGNLGDIVYSLPTVKALGGGNFYILQSSNPILPVERQPRPMSLQEIDQMVTFLKTQSYIYDAAVYSAQMIDIDLDQWKFHSGRGIHIAVSHLKACSAYYDLSRKWLENIEPEYEKEIIIQYSSRWLHPAGRLNWALLKSVETNCAFIGLPEEHRLFENMTGLKVNRLEIRDILEFCRIIKGSRLFIGNQSLGFSLAEGMKHPRVQEIYFHNPNCLPQSKNGAVYLTRAMVQSAVYGKPGNGIFISSEWDQRMRFMQYHIRSIWQKVNLYGFKTSVFKLLKRAGIIR